MRLFYRPEFDTSNDSKRIHQSDRRGSISAHVSVITHVIKLSKTRRLFKAVKRQTHFADKAQRNWTRWARKKKKNTSFIQISAEKKSRWLTSVAAAWSRGVKLQVSKWNEAALLFLHSSARNKTSDFIAMYSTCTLQQGILNEKEHEINQIEQEHEH